MANTINIDVYQQGQTSAVTVCFPTESIYFRAASFTLAGQTILTAINYKGKVFYSTTALSTLATSAGLLSSTVYQQGVFGGVQMAFHPENVACKQTALTIGGTAMNATIYHSLEEKLYYTADLIADLGTASNTGAGGTVTTDATPTASSTNPVQSGGVYSAIPLQAETRDFLSRVLTAVGKVDGASIEALDRFVVRGKNAGWFSSIKQMWVAVGDFAASKIFFITPSGITPTFNNFVAADYAQGRGYQLTSNSTKYVDTGFIPNSNGVTYQSMLLAFASLADIAATTFGRIVGTGTADGEPMVSYRENLFGADAGNGKCDIPFGSEGTVGVLRWGAATYASAINGNIHMAATSAASNVTMTDAVTLFRANRSNGMQYATGSLGFYAIGTDPGSNALIVDMSSAIEDLLREIGVDIYRRPELITFGDSITMGTGATAGSQHANRWGKVLSRKIGFRERNCGQGSSRLGTSSNPPYQPGVTRYTDLTARKAGSTVAIIYGTNDYAADAGTNGTQSFADTFQTNLNTVISGFLAANYRVICGSIPYQTPQATLAKQSMYLISAAAAAKANKVPFADLYNALLDTGSPATYLADGLHPNDAGHQLVAEYMYEAYLGRLLRKPTLDFGSIAAASQADLTVTVYNAVAGMSVNVTPMGTLEAGLIPFAFVSANDTVTVRLTNTTGSAIDPASLQYKVTVFTNY